MSTFGVHRAQQVIRTQTRVAISESEDWLKRKEGPPKGKSATEKERKNHDESHERATRRPPNSDGRLLVVGRRFGGRWWSSDGQQQGGGRTIAIQAGCCGRAVLDGRARLVWRRTAMRRSHLAPVQRHNRPCRVVRRFSLFLPFP